MKNFLVAKIFNEIADLLEIKGDNRFKIMAYRKGAEKIASLPENIEEVIREGRLNEIKGIGKGLAVKIEEIVRNGDCAFHEELTSSFPPGLLDILRVPGVGPRQARLFFDELGISSIEELKQAAKSRKLRKLSGMGAKKERNILDAIEKRQNRAGRYLLPQALHIAREIIYYLSNLPQVKRIEYAGSLRRNKETIGDIDLLVAATEKTKEVMDYFTQIPLVQEVLSKGEKKASIISNIGMQVDLRLVLPEEFPAALVYFTGSREHNVRLRQLAREKGFKLNEYGLFEGDISLKIESEEDLYSRLGLDYVPPELREDNGEIEAALKKNLPQLIKIDNLKGDLHLHTTWSDGGNSIEEMVEEARKMGYEYLAVCDHSRSLKIAGGLTEAQLREQMQVIDELNEKYTDFTILKGTEVDILSGGGLDFPDELLAELDVVVASIHSGFRQSEESITARVIQAIENPHVDIIAHPTGRLLERRPSYSINIERVIKAAAKNNTALELNASPDRLDLNDRFLKMAKNEGVKISINSDAHNKEQLHFNRFGTGIARRGWLEKDDVINTYSLDSLLDFLNYK